MKVKMTYEELVLLERDIDKQKKSSPAFNSFNRSKVAAFYNDNKTAVALAKAKIQEFMNAHVQKDAKGNWSAVTVNGQFVKWAFLSEADEELYKKKYEIFMKNTTVEVIY